MSDTPQIFTGEAEARRHKGALALVLLPMALFSAACAVVWDFTVDDAFIFLRYGQNLANGAGYAFNPGEHIEGATSILWTLIAWFSESAGFEGPILIKLAGVFSGLVTIAAVFFISINRSGLKERLASACLLALYFPFIIWSQSGLETAGAAALGVLGILLAVRPGNISRVISALFLALAFMCRPDMGLFWLVFPLLSIIQIFNKHRPLRLKHFIPHILLGLAFIAISAWRYSEFGALYPNTAISKVSPDILKALPDGFSNLLHLLLVQGLVLTFIPLLFLKPLKNAASAVILAVILLFTLYVVSMGEAEMGWLFRFYIPIIPLHFALLAEGLTELKTATRSGIYKTAVVLCFISALLCPFTGLRYWEGSMKDDFNYNISLAEYSRGVNEVYRQIGEELNRSLPPEASIAIVDAGAIPYYAKRKTLDLWGLNDRKLALIMRSLKKTEDTDEEGRALYSRQYTDAVFEHAPTLFIDTHLPPPLTHDGRFTDCYKEIDLGQTFIFNRALNSKVRFFQRTCP